MFHADRKATCSRSPTQMAMVSRIRRAPCGSFLKRTGLATHTGKLYIATINEVYCAMIQADDDLGAPRKILDHLPGAGQHPNRTSAFSPDG
jgi:glucose/arabinose dehydrogenase